MSFNSNEKYEACIQLKREIKLEAKDPRFGIDGSWYNCMKKLRCLNPASYGCRAETKIREILALRKASVFEDKGDSLAINSDFFPIDSYIEIKVSFLDVLKSKMDLRQIRLWQDTQFYLCIAVDLDEAPISFALSKEDMKQECDLIGSNTHGTRKANEENENLEKSISIDCVPGNLHYERWLQKYLRNDISKILFTCYERV